MSREFSEKYELEGTFENLLSHRFSRFDHSMAEYLKKQTKYFFESFIETYLSKEVEYNEKHGG